MDGFSTCQRRTHKSILSSLQVYRFRDEDPLLVGEEQEEFDPHQSVMYTKVRISPESQFIASLLVSSTF